MTLTVRNTTNRVIHMVKQLGAVITIYHSPLSQWDYIWLPAKAGNAWFLMCCCLDDPRLFLCFGIFVHESLFCPEQLNLPLFFRKILQHIFCFSSIFSILTLSSFPAAAVWFWDLSLHTEDNWGTHTIKLYKRSKHSQMLKKATWCIKLLKRMKMNTFLFLFKNYIYIFYIIFFFSFSTDL